MTRLRAVTIAALAACGLAATPLPVRAQAAAAVRSADAQVRGASQALVPSPSLDDLIGEPIADVRLEAAGHPVTEPAVLQLVETRAGQPLAVQKVRQSIQHLYALARYEDIRVEARRGERGLVLLYVLEPVRVASRMEFAGAMGLPEGRLREAVRDRLGSRPRLSRAGEAVEVLRALYDAAGFFQASVVAEPVPPDGRGEHTLRFVVHAGPRATIGELRVEGDVPPGRDWLLARLEARPGAPWDPARFEARTARALDELRDRGHYQARIVPRIVRRPETASVDVTVLVEAGPRIAIAFEGDPLPRDRQRRLVPIAQEGTVDEDLLEDSTRRIEQYLHEQGYWRAEVEYREVEPAPGELRIVFSISRGRPFVVAGVEIEGVAAERREDVTLLVRERRGEPFVQALLEDDLVRIARFYQERGFAGVRVDSTVPVATTDLPRGPADALFVRPRIVVTEGPRTVVTEVALEGVQEVPEEAVRAAIRMQPGDAFYQPRMTTDRTAIATAYLNRGHRSVRVESDARFSDDRTGATLTYRVSEGPRSIVDHVIIVGNERTSAATIEQELQFRPGDPVAADAIAETQRRLSALGLFRRVRITEVPSPGEETRDVIVTVEEAPPTTIGYGAGLEGGRILRQPTPGQPAVEQLELAPRGFFEIGRRNLWGKNRSVSLFTRASLRRRDPASETETERSGFGFNEYRVLGVYREPRLFGWSVDAEASAFLEQAIRSSFNFRRNGVNGQISRRLPRDLSIVGRYTFGSTDLFDERYSPDEQPLIDRLYPQVRLSVLSGASFWDTRNDLFEPTRGGLVGIETDLALRAIGSEVGYVKNLAQGFVYRRVPGTGRLVFAGGARLGLARGFRQEAELPNGPAAPGGQGRVIIEDLPASERFYAGGDTTVRGYALDRLGDAAVLDQNGFPTGGDALAIFNAELRFPVWRALGGVLFVDAGNVFARVSDLDPSRLKTSTGFGIRYRSPVGPIRVDFGIKLQPTTFANGTREPRTALHISLGQAF
jgi:outer membrane protein insertion porin family